MKWREEYKIDSQDLDFNGVARASVLMRYMQESANSQCRALGPSLESLREEHGLAFLLSRFSAGFYATVFAYDNLVAETWGVESRGFSFHRCYRLWRGDTVVAEACAVWALVDVENRRPVRVSEYRPGFEYDEMLTLDTPPRIVFPSEPPLRLVREHTVTYGETDMNMHMNNTKYPDMLCDFMPIDQVERISDMTLEFLRESALGDTLEFVCAREESDFYFKTQNGAGDVCLSAKITVK